MYPLNLSLFLYETCAEHLLSGGKRFPRQFLGEATWIILERAQRKVRSQASQDSVLLCYSWLATKLWANKSPNLLFLMQTKHFMGTYLIGVI